MLAGSNVRPQKWTDVLDLFDNGEYSAIWGRYDNSQRRSLGVRWNGDSSNPNNIGYPRQADKPLWYVEPQFLTEAILQALLTIVIQQYDHNDQWTRNLKIALDESGGNIGIAAQGINQARQEQYSAMPKPTENKTQEPVTTEKESNRLSFFRILTLAAAVIIFCVAFFILLFGVIGLVVFGEKKEAFALIISLIIIASGVYSVYLGIHVMRKSKGIAKKNVIIADQSSHENEIKKFADVLEKLLERHKVSIGNMARSFCGNCKKHHPRQWFQFNNGDSFYLCSVAEPMIVMNHNKEWFYMSINDFILKYAPSRTSGFEWLKKVFRKAVIEITPVAPWIKIAIPISRIIGDEEEKERSQ